MQIIKSFDDMHEKKVIQILSASPSLIFDAASNHPHLQRRMTGIDTNCPLCAQVNLSTSTKCYFCQCYTNNTDDNGNAFSVGRPSRALWTGPRCSKQVHMNKHADYEEPLLIKLLGYFCRFPTSFVDCHYTHRSDYVS